MFTLPTVDTVVKSKLNDGTYVVKELPSRAYRCHVLLEPNWPGGEQFRFSVLADSFNDHFEVIEN